MTVHYGWHAVTRVPDVVRAAGAGRVLLVCGGRSFPASGASRVLPELDRVADVVRWNDFRPNPDAVDLVRGLAVLRDTRPDLVLGVGGGSALDMAKLLCAFADRDTEPALRDAIRAGAPVRVRGPGLVLVPTTSGSGSEATSFAVVYLDGVKHSVAGYALAADTVVLDPALALGCPRHVRASAGLDAVAQAVESLWAVAASDVSRRWARFALRLLLPAIEPFTRAPTERTARAMAIGSHLAGRAIAISRTTAAHALSYGLTTRYGVGHGHAVALTLGAFIRRHGAASPGPGRFGVSLARHTEAMRAVCTAFGAAGPDEAATRFEGLVRSLGLPARLRDVGVRAERQLADLVSGVDTERLANNPVRFGPVELLDLVRDCR